VRRHDPFRAIADSTRRAILQFLRQRGVCTAGEIAGRFRRISRPAVSRHLRVLREAGLVVAQGVGREQRYRLDVTVLARMQRDWFAPLVPAWQQALAALKQQVESPAARRKHNSTAAGRVA